MTAATVDKMAGKSSPQYYKPAPAQVAYGPMRFLITERPSDITMPQFLDECAKHNVKAVVRVCQPSYDVVQLNEAGIRVLDWEFNDGSPPPHDIRDKWLQLVRDIFRESNEPCIAVHCVAGLGRAPVLVAIALIESGIKYEDAVDMIRQVRRGALNQKQLAFLEKYKSSGALKKMASGKTKENCTIM